MNLETTQKSSEKIVKLINENPKILVQAPGPIIGIWARAVKIDLNQTKLMNL